MAKKIDAYIKLQVKAGQANPSPPVGPALGQHGVNIMDFVKAYNARTEAQAGTVVPTEITIYEDRTFDFILKTPPTSTLIREKAGLDLVKVTIVPEPLWHRRKTRVRRRSCAAAFQRMPRLGRRYGLEMTTQQKPSLQWP